ncbi:MAG: sulfotransferase domain-containing protein [Candidatus Wallbacteria bacterium]|nr:sulfotransferase domain-containing protein [Candidatus Wallbacteria bacterium]MBI4867363.1 sulfotransferase domain-containing protein [Candidatus Wallbacteria bacterium]
MSQIVWLASYPKSGNTWVRAFLTNYLSGDAQPAAIDSLDVGVIASSRNCFDEWVGVEAAELDDPLVNRIRPAVYRAMARNASTTLFLKVHDAWSLTDRAESLFPADVTRCAIYIVRNPLDVAVSAAHHNGSSLLESVGNLCDRFHALGRSERGVRSQLPATLRCWSGHVRSWLEESALPVHPVRYEDLLDHPEETFGALVCAAGLPHDSARLRVAIANSRFTELAGQERARGFHERLEVASAPFFRRGKAGTWRDELPPELVSRLLEAHGEMMIRLGYEISRVP